MDNSFPFSTPLQEPKQFLIIWPVIGIIMVLAGIWLFLHECRRHKWLMYRKRKRNIAEELPRIKADYLGRFATLKSGVSDGSFDTRTAYQLMSAELRGFVEEVTEVNVTEQTLHEIINSKKLNASDRKSLAKLVSRYYEPEFAKASKANALTAIRETEKVIKIWSAI